MDHGKRWWIELGINLLILTIVLAVCFSAINLISGSSITGFSTSTNSYSFLTSFTPSEVFLTLTIIFGIIVSMIIFASFLTI